MVNQTTDVNQEAKGVATEPEKKKKGFWQKFVSFLMMGGFLVIIILIVVIVIAISILTAKPA